MKRPNINYNIATYKKSQLRNDLTNILKNHWYTRNKCERHRIEIRLLCTSKSAYGKVEV